MIESTAPVGWNIISANTLAFENIAVHSTYSAMSFAGQISATGAPSFAPPQFANSNEKGTVWTAVSPATINITGGALQTQNLSNLRRDTLKTNPELNALPNLQAILSDQGRTMKEYQQAAQIVATGIGDLAGRLQQQALARGDTATAKLWGEGGAYRAIMHSIAGGVLGGVNGVDGALQGAAGGAVSTLIIPVIDKAIRDAMIARGLDPDKQGSAAAYFKNLIAGLLVNGVTTAVSGTNGGAYAGFNYKDNYLFHDENLQREKIRRELAKCRANPSSCSAKLVADYEKQLEHWNALDRMRDRQLIDACSANKTGPVCITHVKEAMKAIGILPEDGLQVVPGIAIHLPGVRDMLWRIENGYFDGTGNEGLAAGYYLEYLQTYALLAARRDSVEAAIGSYQTDKLFEALGAVVGGFGGKINVAELRRSFRDYLRGEYGGSSPKQWTKTSRIKAEDLPRSGKIRYVPPESYDGTSPLPKGPNNGFIDKFGNEWVKGPSRTAGDAWEWDVQLSRTGKAQLGWASSSGDHINVSLSGEITH